MDDADEELMVFLSIVLGVGALWLGLATLLAVGIAKAVGLRDRRH